MVLRVGTVGSSLICWVFLGECYFYRQIIRLYCLHIGLYDRSKAVMQLLFEYSNRASKNFRSWTS